MPSEHHAKHPRLEELEGMVRSGEIDTLVVAITDMQGRLVGKRVQAQAFLAGVISHGAHFCTYLLGTDMEMNTPDGFALMNWETGYGDWIAEPVWDTLRVLPWLEKTALVLADATDGETGDEIPVSPRTMLKRQVDKAAEMGLDVKCGSELEYYVLRDSWESLADRGWPVPKPFFLQIRRPSSRVMAKGGRWPRPGRWSATASPASAWLGLSSTRAVTGSAPR